MRLLAASEAARNYLLAAPGGAAPLFLKLRADPGDSADREAVTLARLAPGLGPVLEARLAPRQLMARAVAARDLRCAAQLDLAVGDGLLLEQLPGRPLTPPVSDAAMDRVAELLARLRQTPPRGLPRAPVSPKPGAIRRTLEERLAEIRRRRLVDGRTARAMAAASRRIDAHLDRCWRRGDRREVSALCHGDLRWHNILAHRGELRLVDFEHAGVGDPAVDLALMVNRTPLSRHDELRLLDAYLARIDDRGFLDRYFTARPVVALFGAAEAILDLANAHRDRPAMAHDPVAYARERAPFIVAELRDALALARPGTAPPRRPRLRFETPRRSPAPLPPMIVAVDGTAGSLKSEIARALARQLGLPHYDTGVAYRYAALWAHAHALRADRPADERQLLRHLRRQRLELLPGGRLRAGARELFYSLVSAPVEAAVAAWAARPAVRAALAAVVEAAVRRRAGLIEGRDVGTALAPTAAVKIFIDAPLADRAAWLAQRSGWTAARAARAIAARDHLDATRQLAPLRVAPGAWRVDSRSAHPEVIARRLAQRIRRRRR